jgi:hypothetical protein
MPKFNEIITLHAQILGTTLPSSFQIWQKLILKPNEENSQKLYGNFDEVYEIL